MSLSDRMKEKLINAFAPSFLDIRDDSHKHIGHAGHNGQGESHFHITIRAGAFDGKNRVEQQRMVYNVLTDELKSGIHALSLKIER